MSVETTLLAYTYFAEDLAKDFFGYIPQWDYQDAEGWDYDDPRWDDGTLPTPADELGEFAGRNCYQAWHRPNPHTAGNRGYLENILDQGHESVLEHASVTVGIKGVSTALLGQLSRHRHLSFSVLSKRYVDESESKYMIHPGLEEFLDQEIYEPPSISIFDSSPTIKDLIDGFHLDARTLYSELVEFLVKKGKTRKQAREIARGVLPQATETRMVVTGNLRAWRYVIQKRNHPGADEEIQELAKQLLGIMKKVAPNSFQDMGESA